MGAEDTHNQGAPTSIVRERIKSGVLYTITILGVAFRFIFTLDGIIRLDRSSKDGMPTDSASTERGWRKAERLGRKHDDEVRGNS